MSHTPDSPDRPSPPKGGRRLILAAALALFAAVGTVTPSTRGGTPNFLLILADDMGYGDPQCYNSESQIPTPHIDRLAREGVRFTDAHSPESYCIPTRYGLLTGQYPCRVQLRIDQEPGIPPTRATLATLLRDHGYRTAMVGKWHLGFEGGQHQSFADELRGGPVDRGFQSYFGLHASLDIPPYFFIRDRHAIPAPTESIDASASPEWSPIQGAFWRQGRIAPGFQHADVLPRLEAESIAFLRQQAASQPFFLYVALTAPHTPWLPAPEFQGQSGAGMYGDFTAQVDAVVGNLLRTLDEQKMQEDTLVIFTSDNGPVWYPGDAERWGHRATGPYRGMKADSFEGGHRMPFLVRWPGHAKAGAVCDSLICQTDVMATYAEIIGTEVPSNSDSTSLLPALRHPEDHPTLRDTLIVRKEASVVRKGKWKLIHHLGSGGFSEPRHEAPSVGGPTGQLYNLADDPGETRNLWLQHPDVVTELLAIRARYARHD